MTPIQKTNVPLRILILGGTGFIGAHEVRYAVQRGHTVTVFNRGLGQADLPPGVQYLRGDRSNDLDSLKAASWDAVIDNSATDPAWVRLSAELLRDRAKLYMYVSSTGVYFPYVTTDISEAVKPVLIENPSNGWSSFGVRKALSEIEVEKAFLGRTIIVRPHYIVGPGDTTYRFPYWPQRVERGGEILAPGRRTDAVQFVDVRDLTEWMIRMVELEATGTYNVAGPRTPLSMTDFLTGVRASLGVSENDVRFTWIDDYDFLEENGVDEVVPWVPLCGDALGSASINFDKALRSGLTHRPLAETVRDTLAWWNSSAVPPGRRAKPDFALTPEKEEGMLAAWKARTVADTER
ncbi:NAD-dependent epimerase/dehydratase family protein [Mesorhizobium sp. M0618]|uniref:NAD-dependent epimerase/dehydratase family protein n=1 Tax=unclassified Mesorhizobium TaxID=325217 RepID=UPI00333D8CB8